MNLVQNRPCIFRYLCPQWEKTAVQYSLNKWWIILESSPNRDRILRESGERQLKSDLLEAISKCTKKKEAIENCHLVVMKWKSCLIAWIPSMMGSLTWWQRG